MNITGSVPKHLVVSARTGFLSAVTQQEMPWRKVAKQLNMGSASQQLVDLGAAPMPKNSKTGATVQGFVEKAKLITPVSWDITVGVSQDAVDDDQTGQLEEKVRSAGENFQKHINQRVFTVLNAGDSTTYGLCYDGQEFFDSDHVDGGADYQTAQDNEGALTLSLDNFNTSWVAAKAFRDDQGNFADHNYDTLIVPPALYSVGMNIIGNVQAYDTANREVNPFAGHFELINSPYLDATAWFLVAGNESAKPLIVGMRKEPHLQSAWFDATQPDGGMHYFKFYARYEVHYADWRLAYMGQT